LITLPLLYFPIRRYLGVAVALLAIGLLAISPWHLFWSQNARQYTSLLLFYSLGMFVFYHWLETDRFRYLLVAGLLMILAVLERMNAAFFGPVVVLYFLSFLVFPINKPAGLNRRNLFILALPVLAFTVYQIFVLGAIEEYSFWILGRVHNPLRVLLSLVYDIGLPLFLLALAGGAYLLAQRSRLGLFLILNALVPVLILVALSPFTQAFSRYVFMILPVWAVLGAVAIKEIWMQTQKNARVLALGLALVLFAEPLSQNVLYYGFQNGNRENYKDAFALVQQHKQTEDFVVSTRSEIGEYYLGHEVVDSNRIDLDGIIASGHPAWFVMDNRTHVSERLQTWIGSETQLVDVYDVYVPGRPMTMRVYYFDPEEMP
jgi:mannosyltransferase